MRTETLLRRSLHLFDVVIRRCIVTAAPFKIKRALVLSKTTRYEVEKLNNPTLSDVQVERLIRDRGSDYDSLLEHHLRHKDYEKSVLDILKSNAIFTKVVSRLDYSPTWIDQCDAVFPVGGDGTFLLAASRVRSDKKPLIGFNSDPEHSEGFLCLDKSHSHAVQQVLMRLNEGSFSWMFRTRVRVTLKTKNYEPPVDIHDNKSLGTEDRSQVESSVEHTLGTTGQPGPAFNTHYALALNEAFVGERLSAQVSYFELSTDGAAVGTKVKSSGMCVCSGTGSSSWHLSMNRVTRHCVARVLRCAANATAAAANDPDVCQQIADEHNGQLLFHPEDQKMCYTIRDLITSTVWPSPSGLAPSAFAQSLRVRSYCRDAQLVVDGGLSYAFNDGSEAFLEIRPGDALRTVVL